MAAPNIANVTSIYGKTMGAALGITTTTDILTCPSNKVLKINSLITSNSNATGAASLYVSLYDSSLTRRFPLGYGIVVPLKATLVVIGKDSPIYLEEGDQIEAAASATGDLNLIISYEELDDA